MNTKDYEGYDRSQGQSRESNLPGLPWRSRRSIWLSVMVVLFAGSAGAAWLKARPAPLVPVASPTPSAAPVITWSANALDIILAPGESTTRNLTFTSSESIKDIRIEAVPEIAPFVTITPAAFSRVPASGPQTVQIRFSVPGTANLGDFEGTIHVRSGRQALPQTLKVGLHTWKSYRNPDHGLGFNYPPTFHVDNVTPALGQVAYIVDNNVPGVQGGFDVDFGCSIEFSTELNLDLLTVREWMRVNLRSDGEDSEVTISGETAIRKMFVDDITSDRAALIAVSRDNRVHVFSAVGSACIQALDRILSTMSFTR